LTKEGVAWLLKALRETHHYLDRIDGLARNISTCAAVSGCHVVKGQQVGLVMKQGILMAQRYDGQSAQGIAATDAGVGEDVGISSIEGIVELSAGEVVILSVPGIQRGGSRRVDLNRLAEETSGGRTIGAIGVEALVGLRRIGVEPHYLYGVREVAIEAAQCGLSITVVSANSEVSLFADVLEDKHIEYRVIDLQAPAHSP
jgi:putative transcriptional regulator